MTRAIDYSFLNKDIVYAVTSNIDLDEETISQILSSEEAKEMSLPLWIGLQAIKEAKTEDRSTQSSVTYRSAVNLARKLLGKPLESYVHPSLRN